MVLRWIYYGVCLSLTTPYILWNGFVSLIMWDATYFDNACHGIYETLSDNKATFLNQPNVKP